MTSMLKGKERKKPMLPLLQVRKQYHTVSSSEESCAQAKVRRNSNELAAHLSVTLPEKKEKVVSLLGNNVHFYIDGYRQ